MTATALVRQLGAWERHDEAGYAALATRIQTLLVDGRLAAGTRVPSERELAVVLAIGRGTVAAAYERLRETGYLASRRGSGSWTALPAADSGYATPFAPGGLAGAVIDLAHASPYAPVERVATASARAVEALPRHLTGPGYDLLGLPLLREAVAEWLTRGGLATAADQLMITSGSQQGLVLALRALVHPGDRVLVEHPTYPNALEAVRHASARAVPVAFGPDGWDLPLLSSSMRETRPALAYLVPDHHNPTGLVMPVEQRAALVAAAHRHGVPLVVDESLRDLHLDGPAATPPPSVGSWGSRHASDDAPIVTLGSLSKSVWGGLRIGWLRAPRAVVRRIATVRASVDLSGPVLEQLVALELLAGLDDLLAERRELFATRRDHLAGVLAAALPEWTANRPPGGLSLWVDLGAPTSSALVEAASRHGVQLAAGPRFGVGGAFEGFLRLPFSQAPDVLDDAVDRLTAAWGSLGRAPEAMPLVV